VQCNLRIDLGVRTVTEDVVVIRVQHGATAYTCAGGRELASWRDLARRRYATPPTSNIRRRGPSRMPSCGAHESRRRPRVARILETCTPDGRVFLAGHCMRRVISVSWCARKVCMGNRRLSVGVG
jgi:hypothetical protein